MARYIQLALLSFLASSALAAPSPNWAVGDYDILEATHRTKGTPISIAARSTGSTSSSTSTTTSSPRASTATSAKLTSSAALTSSLSTKTSSAAATASLSCPGSNGVQYTTGGQSFVVQCFVDHAGGDMDSVSASSLESCLAACAGQSQCVDVAWVPGTPGTCYMKNSLKTGVANNNVWGAQILSSLPSTSSPLSSSVLLSSSSSSRSKTSSLISTTLATSTRPATSSLLTSSSVHLTSSSPVATATAAVSKRGMAYNDASFAGLFKSSSQVKWGYNWWQESGGLSSGFNFVPMLWGATSGFTNTWATNVANSLAAGSTHILAFNEPDLAQQSNMTAAAAATAYKQWIQPYASQAKLVSPAITNGNTPTMGFNWMSSFIEQCTGCTIDVIAIHWYNNVGTNDDFKNHVQTAYQTFGKPIWITEFGLNDATNDQVTAFLEDVLPWLDEQEYVERYSYFMVAQGMLVSSDGSSLSSYGSTFASYTSS